MVKKSKKIAEELGLGRPRRRPARVAQAIQQELAVLFLRGVNDPLVGTVTITGVEVSPDLRRAVVYYDTPPEEAGQAAAGLNRAKGYMRSYLAGQLNLRTVPELVFKRDLGAANQARIEELLREEDHDDPAAD